MMIEEVGKAFDASDAGVFVDFFAVAANCDDGVELAGSDSGEIKIEVLIFELGVG